MAQIHRKQLRDGLPNDLSRLTDREILERVLGKRLMKAVGETVDDMDKKADSAKTTRVRGSIIATH